MAKPCLPKINAEMPTVPAHKNQEIFDIHLDIHFDRDGDEHPVDEPQLFLIPTVLPKWCGLNQVLQTQLIANQSLVQRREAPTLPSSSTRLVELSHFGWSIEVSFADKDFSSSSMNLLKSSRSKIGCKRSLVYKSATCSALIK